MQSVNVFVLLVAITVSLCFQGVSSYEIVGDLSLLKDQFQTLITELENEDVAYDTSIATLLEKLDLLQHSSSPRSNVSLDWFVPPKDIPIHTPLRITIVVSSFEGMFLNSGIGTFYSSLSDFLVQQGHAVTILYTDTAASDTPAFTRWKAQVEKRGLRAARLGPYPIHLRLSTLAQRSYQVFEYLKNHQSEFDVVHFPDWEGSGYYSTLAKNDGIAFMSKLFVIGIHGPWRWVKAANNPSKYTASLTTAEDMETDWMERKSVEMADMVWTPSSDIVEWLAKKGWAIPSSLFKMPYLPGREITQVNLKDSEEFTDAINELVFFGRLETRKGLELFADALDRLSVTRPEFAGTKITFLGRAANIGNQTATAYIDERFVKGAWPFKVVYISHKDRKAALEYLREPTRIAVIPSIVDNTPYTVYECLFSNIPFIASSIPSIASIIDPNDRARVLFEVDPISLAKKLEYVLDNGAGIVKSSLQLSEIEASWTAFYAEASVRIEGQRRAMKNNENNKKQQPLVSVCITHFNRPHFLQLALESVQTQTYTNYEVILVDDGSTSQAAKDYLASITPTFAKKGWQLLLSNNQYLGAARNKAALNARGEYLIFLDDDNLLTPKSLQTYVEVAAQTRADILTAAHDVFEGNGVAADGTVVGRWVPLGASPSVGLFKNCFGDANFFVRKSAFVSLKGFTEDRNVGQEDHEFLAKAVLDGRSLVVIPEPLLAYRMHNQSDQMLYTTDSLKNALRAHRPYRSLMAESGIGLTEQQGSDTRSNPATDALKLLAYSRAHSRQAAAQCNLTVSSVSPTQIPVRTRTQLTFTVSIRDCDISSVRIGDTFPCTLGAVSASQFSCTTPPIPVAGNYPVYVLLASESTVRDTGTRITVATSPSPNGETAALATLAVYREAGLFDADELMGLLAGIIPIPTSSFTVLSDVVSGGAAKRALDATDELHTLVISITSATPPASQAFALILQVLSYKPTVILPYRFSSLVLNAVCDATGQCSCTPNFVGTSCTAPASCLNDCSGNGNCTTGSFSKVCVCKEGWTGADCSTGLCVNNCNGRGSCELEYKAGNGTCKCNAGWNGTACEIPNCPGNCSGNACKLGVCQCPAGITTPDCTTLGGGEVTGKIVDNSGSNSNSDRDVFIAVAVIFAVLILLVLLVMYHVYRRGRNDGE